MNPDELRRPPHRRHGRPRAPRAAICGQCPL